MARLFVKLKNEKVTIGEAIKQFRKEKKVSQEKLALEAEISRYYVYLIETGIHSPTYATLEKIAASLGVKVSDIVLRVEAE